ncbi:MAG: PQQ-binding-like beta-propeller repeat protein, partial [Armatimonadota bacterium]
WPARGGPAVVDGIVYWGAGIWPSEGIYLYAVDAMTGEVLWCNDSAGGMYMPQPHGGADARSGVSIQGYVVASGDRLIVPTGRAVPAAFRRDTGEFLYFHLQQYGKAGGSDVAATDAAHFIRGHMFDGAGGKLISRFGASPSAMAVAPSTIVYAPGEQIHALDRGNMWTRKQSVDAEGQKTTTTTLAAPRRSIKSPVTPVRCLIVAGDAVAVGGSGRVGVCNMTTKKVLLDAEVDGEPLGLAASGGRLFVSTDTGAIHCFGRAGAAPANATPDSPGPHSAESDVHAAAAEEIVRLTGATEGYCLDLGCGDGSLALALARRTQLRIYAVDDDPANVALARRRLEAAGLYGVRATVHQRDPGHTAYPNYFANLVVSGRSVAGGAGAVPMDEVTRMLRPFGGTACLGKPGAMQTTARGDLAGAGTWTHQYCDPANTSCSTDTIVRGPLGVLWFTDLNFQMPSRHGRGPAPLFDNGRLFVEGVNALRCVDAYNGRSVWEYPLPGILRTYDGEHLMGTSGTSSNFCLGEGALFLRTEGKCLRIDPATGELLGTLPAPAGGDGKPGTWGMIICVGDTLIGTLANTAHLVSYRYGKGDMNLQWTESGLLFAMDATSGRPRWTWQPEHSIRHNAVAVGSGRVYVIDRPMAESDREREVRRGIPDEGASHPDGTLVALDLSDGSVVWSNDESIYGTLLALSEQHNTLLMCYQDWRFKLASEVGGRMTAFDASTGRRRWEAEASYVTRPVIRGRTIYMQPGAWDLLTGEQQDYEFRRTYGCGILAGSVHLSVFRSGTFGYTDFLHPHGTENYGGIRPGCWINAIPAGGLVLMPDATDRCSCSYLIKSSIALQPWGVRPPAISPNGAAARDAVQVALAADAPGATIRYTLDGSSPMETSPRYTTPVTVAETSTLRARAFVRGQPPSEVTEASFTIDPGIVSLGGPDWRVHDSPGASPPASNWEVSDGVATELSNHFKGEAGNSDPLVARPGTYRSYAPGRDLTDGELSLELSSADNDGIGVAFRFGGPGRHYEWAMDAQRGYHRLACKDGDSFRVLARNTGGYQANRWYSLRIVLAGPRITVYLDGEKDLEATDDTLGKGTFA